MTPRWRRLAGQGVRVQSRESCARGARGNCLRRDSLAGVIIPLGVEPASLSNFLGYIAWCLWLLALAVVLWRRPSKNRPDPTAAQSAAAARVHRG